MALLLAAYWHSNRSQGLCLYGLRAIIGPLCLLLMVVGLVLDLKFGSPLLTGYHQSHDPPKPHTFLGATADFLWGGQGSIFLHYPLLLLALPAMGRFAKRYPLEFLFPLLSLFIIYSIVALPGGSWRGEMAYGPRYFVVFLPLLALPALYPLQWMLQFPRTRARTFTLVACGALSLFFAGVQMEVNRLDFFFKYWIEIKQTEPGSAPPPKAVTDYFANTNFALINWEHIHYRGQWDRLPYYAELKAHLHPQSMEVWQNHMETELSRGNLYWFSRN